jgi:hypothetical protein
MPRKIRRLRCNLLIHLSKSKSVVHKDSHASIVPNPANAILHNVKNTVKILIRLNRMKTV